MNAVLMCATPAIKVWPAVWAVPMTFWIDLKSFYWQKHNYYVEPQSNYKNSDKIYCSLKWPSFVKCGCLQISNLFKNVCWLIQYRCWKWLKRWLNIREAIPATCVEQTKIDVIASVITVPARILTTIFVPRLLLI